MELFIGVDVGANGGIAIVDQNGALVRVSKTPDGDDAILAEMFVSELLYPLVPRRGVIEQVHASPQMGVKSAFSFGGSYRALKMAMTAAKIPFTEVSPVKWQRVMDCLSGGDKNVTKMRAQHLFPDTRVTHAIADALLLAEYCRRLHLQLVGSQR